MFTLIQYLIWHYFDVPREILKGWRNFLKFNLNYFSTPLLIRTLFSPWRRYIWSYGKGGGLDIGRHIVVIFSNVVSRILGAIMRLFLIIVGLLFEVLFFFLGLFVFLGWLIIPAILILGLIVGFILIL